MHAWNAERQVRNEPLLRIGIGAHYGSVTLGEIGSLRRVEFAVVGDTVNLANRLEALTRRLETTAVISRALVEAASADSKTDAALLDLFVPIAPQAIEGYDAPVAVSVLDHAKLDGRLAAAKVAARPEEQIPVMPAKSQPRTRSGAGSNRPAPLRTGKSYRTAALATATHPPVILRRAEGETGGPRTHWPVW